MIAFDIGSNIGKWAIANSALYNTIISVEASPSTFQRLQEHCLPFSNIIPLNFAVCNNGGQDIVFYEASADVISTLNREWLSNSNSRFCGMPHREIMCKTITLDTLIEKYGKPDLIKIDVEGAEYDCISSLSQHVDTICFEWASEMYNISYRCIDYLETIGFTRFCVQLEDQYTFRPNDNDYYSSQVAKELLGMMTPKQEWGMIWSK